MQRKKYPLEPLAQLKKDRAEIKVRELGKAVARREGLEKERKGQEAQREETRAKANVVRGDERALLEKGDLKVLDLVRGSIWESRIKVEDAERTRELEKALVAEGQARLAEEAAKGRVSEARAEAETVERHRDRWKSALHEKQEAEEEESLAEAVRPKRAP
jgi:hypothetical protein